MVLGRLAERFVRPPEPSPELAKALLDLNRVIASREDLETAGRSLGKILIAAFSEEVPLRPGSPDGPVRSFRLNPPNLDPGRLHRRLRAILAVIEPASPALESLRSAVKRGTIDLVGWSRDVLEGRAAIVEAEIRRMGLDIERVGSILRLGLLPELARDSGSTDSTSANCPWCDSIPLLAELRGLERTVRLRCGLCAGDWSGGRTRCLTCGETDHKRIGIFHVDGEADLYRLMVCESCGGRLKFVASLAKLSAPALVVADFASICLDLIDASRLIISSPLSVES